MSFIVELTEGIPSNCNESFEMAHIIWKNWHLRFFRDYMRKARACNLPSRKQNTKDTAPNLAKESNGEKSGPVIK
jgi:hypothetical protein